jgi:predicted transport protein
MSDIKLFRLAAGQATELQGRASDLEKPLQTLIEANLGPLLNIRFVASEHSTGKTHGGRIDSLGLDENNCPVILEYKRSVGENVINQGLFYLDWLMDHKAEFKLLVLDKLGQSAADAVDWSDPRVVCIAADFTRYDGHAVQQIGRNIELIRYRRFGDELLLLESANAGGDASVRAAPTKPSKTITAKPKALETDFPAIPPNAAAVQTAGPDRSFSEVLAGLPAPMLELLASLEGYTLSLGDDVQRKELRLYVAFKRLKNFATVVLHKKNCLQLFLHVDPVPALAVLLNARDVTHIGHWGTGNLEVTLRNLADLDAVKPFIRVAYEGRALSSPLQ